MLLGLNKTIYKVIAVVGAVIIVGTAALIAINRGEFPSLLHENKNKSSTSELGIYGELIDASNPLIPDTFYKSTITILEKDVFEAKAQVSSTGEVESTFTSEEILFYDNKTEKCYILGRRLTFEGMGTVTVTHAGGAFSGSQDFDSSGAITELYGELITKKDKLFDYSNLPVRAEVKANKIFTLVPTKRQDWVITKIGVDTSLGPPMIFSPDALTHVDIGLIPGKSDISISRTYGATDSVLDDLTGGLVTPSGIFNCDFKKITETEAMEDIAQFSEEIIDNQNKEEFIPDLPPLPDENKDSAVDNVHGLPLPEGYPQDVLPISKDAFIAISEIIPNESGKNGFAITLKVTQTKEEAQKEYGNLIKNASTFAMNGILTMAGEKDGHECSIMIMDNSLGGNEKTMIQIIINPLED